MSKKTVFAGAIGALGLCGLAGASGGPFNNVNVTPYVNETGSVQGPLQLYYQTTDLNNGTWLYNFTLKNTNIDGSWAPGQNFNWIIFGDQANNTPSNLLGWIGDVSSLAGTNFANEGFSSTSGGHNGPSILDGDGFGGGSDGWVPSSVGDVLTWSGTATVDLPEPELLWSNIIGSGVHADFLPAIKVPAPGSIALLGLAGLAAGRRRR